MNTEKTVFILGAGFSIDAGAPSQANILKSAESLHENQKDKDWNELKKFIKKQLQTSKKDITNISLEDIFTPLDRCLSENAQFREISPKQISAIRQAAFHVVSKVLQKTVIEGVTGGSYITKFASYLCETAQKRLQNKGQDQISVISTNWDTLLDNEIYSELQNKYNQPNNNKYVNAVLDYCCHISSLGTDDNTIKPGLEILGSGGFNVKLLKLHGSLNWLQCPRCFRLYTGFQPDILSGEHNCRHCDNNFNKSGAKIHKLESNLIMPTFTKDLSNPQYRIIWQNAGIEISEASNLVFIGYSLPQADFELRQLLSRMTRDNAKILVVDKAHDRATQKEIKAKWRAFFGRRKIKFEFDGAKNYVQKLVKLPE